tara:strand:- start:53338 stop:55788 length:2451 start_codon:yes stop_codon:yes gene_type:complete
VKRFSFTLIILFVGLLSAEQVDLNLASLDEIKTLPLTDEQAEAIYDRLLFQGPFISVYDLMDIEGMDVETFAIIKPLIIISKAAKDGAINRLQDAYRKVERWTSIEGANEGMIEQWLDRLSEPVHIMSATYDDLVALQNVSPVDAVAVVKKQQQKGGIGYPKALRGAPGLSYWGYRNMIDFVTFDSSPELSEKHFWYNLTWKTVPSSTSFDEESESPEAANSYPPAVNHKLVYSPNNQSKFLMAYHRQLGEENRRIAIGSFEIPEFKFSYSFKGKGKNVFQLDRMVFGNYSVTIGQGVVFESTDFWSPRRSGYSWSKRIHGILPDISQTREYALRGAALQGRFANIKFLGFISKHPRDAVLNIDGSFTSLITMYPRRDSVSADGLMVPLTNTVEEVTWGGNMRFEIQPGTFVGFTTYESLYDKELKPDILRSVVAIDEQEKYLTQIGNAADTEIAAMYSSAGSSPLWSAAKSVRRLHGLEFSAVLRDIAIQGELGILDKDGKISDIKSDPKALVVTSFLQVNNLNLLAVYRDYDLEYDNPYQRSFSNYQRYKSTIFEDVFYLKDPVFGYLYSGNSQPQAERGIYLSSRYQFHRQWVTTNEIDMWTRVADNSKYYRIVARFEYRPVFNYRFKIRQKWQQRASFNDWTPTGFDSRETRLEAILRLSRYDNLRLLYALNKVLFSPRRRLSLDLGSLGESNSMVGASALKSEAIGFTVIHNFSDRMKVLGSVIMYNGFFWNFEDTDFRVFDSPKDALRWWVTFFTRIGDRWAMRFKISTDASYPITNYNFAIEDYERIQWSGLSSQNESIDFRIQLDYAY